jgi:hypothetical protein
LRTDIGQVGLGRWDHASGAAALNQLLEREYDQKMKRTENRPRDSLSSAKASDQLADNSPRGTFLPPCNKPPMVFASVSLR